MNNCFSQPVGYASTNTAQNVVNLRSHVLTDVRLTVYQDPRVLFCIAAFQALDSPSHTTTQGYSIPGAGFHICLYRTSWCSHHPLSSVWFQLPGNQTMQHINCSLWFPLICKLTEGTFHTIVHVLAQIPPPGHTATQAAPGDNLAMYHAVYHDIPCSQAEVLLALSSGLPGAITHVFHSWKIYLWTKGSSQRPWGSYLHCTRIKKLNFHIFNFIFPRVIYFLCQKFFVHIYSKNYIISIQSVDCILRSVLLKAINIKGRSHNVQQILQDKNLHL